MNVRSLLTSALVSGALIAGLTLSASGEPSPGYVEDVDRDRPEQSGVLSGQVSGNDSPLISAGVYAYRLADLTLRKALTDDAGLFSFAALPAGLYKIIVHKPGFVPAVVLLTRTTSGAYQFLDFELAEVLVEEDGVAEQDFWSVRERIPGDVLRQMQMAEANPTPADLAPTRRFQTMLRALSGTDSAAGLGGAQLTGGDVDLIGQLGAVQLALQGAFRDLQPPSGSPGGFQAETTAVSLSLRHADDSQIRVHSQRNSLASVDRPVDLEHHGVSWSQKLGEAGRSLFAAHLTDESNYYNDARFDGLGLAEASKTFSLEGSYQGRLGTDTALQTGISYRERVGGVGSSMRQEPATARSRIELFGLADWTVEPAVVVQYGLLTTLNDGSVSVMPHGGLVLQLGEHWSAETAARRRVKDAADDQRRDFVPLYYGTRAECGSVEDHCYKIRFTRQLDNEGAVSLGALHREFSDTLRVFFSEDFFDQLQSVVLVDGDELPEIQFAISQRLGPNVLATLQSNLASGGGGVVRAADEGGYRNAVRYLVTSLNTEFEQTSTGIVLAFHRMQQELKPIEIGQAVPADLDMDRLQILLTQEFDALLGLANEWAVELDMELSRGANPWDVLAADELRKRFVGGLALRF